MKNNDKLKYGESGIQKALFQRPVKQNWKTNHEQESSEERKIEDVIEMKEALLRAGSMKKEKLDEHQKSWKVSRNELLKQRMKRKKTNDKDDLSPSYPQKQSKKRTSLFSATTTKKKKPSTNSSIDHIEKCLEVANTEIYKKTPTQKIGVKQVKSKTPHGMKCSICDNQVKELLMASCNHIACPICWEKWLKRSLTCPSCRRPMKKDELTMAVFHEEAKRLPSLTQMCASDDDDSFDDEELEIIGTANK